jgi:two-component system sensor histidine kinase KdpD
VSEALLQVARERNVTQIVVGKPDKPSLWRKSLADQLILGSGDIDVCVVRPLASAEKAPQPACKEPVPASTIGEFSWVLVSVFTIASLCWGMVSYTGYMFVALVFLLAVVLAALRFSRGPVLLMATLSAAVLELLLHPAAVHVLHQQSRRLDHVRHVLHRRAEHGQPHQPPAHARDRRAPPRLRQTDALLRVTQSAALAAEPEKGLAEALRTINETAQRTTPRSSCASRTARCQKPRIRRAVSPSAKEWGVVAWTHTQQANRRTLTPTPCRSPPPPGSPSKPRPR